MTWQPHPHPDPPLEGEEKLLRIACDSCHRRSYKAGGLLRCLEWRRHPTVVRCSHYVGPIQECHFKLYWGPEYADTFACLGATHRQAHARIKR